MWIKSPGHLLCGWMELAWYQGCMHCKGRRLYQFPHSPPTHDTSPTFPAWTLFNHLQWHYKDIPWSWVILPDLLNYMAKRINNACVSYSYIISFPFRIHAGSVPCWLHTIVLQRVPSPYILLGQFPVQGQSLLYTSSMPKLMQGNMRNYYFWISSSPPPSPSYCSVYCVSGAYDVCGAPGVCGTPGACGVCVSLVPVVPQMPIWLLVQPCESILFILYCQL